MVTKHVIFLLPFLFAFTTPCTTVQAMIIAACVFLQDDVRDDVTGENDVTAAVCCRSLRAEQLQVRAATVPS